MLLWLYEEYCSRGDELGELIEVSLVLDQNLKNHLSARALVNRACWYILVLIRASWRFLELPRVS